MEPLSYFTSCLLFFGVFFGLVNEQPGLMDGIPAHGRVSDLELDNLCGPFQPKPYSDCEFIVFINPVWAAFALSITFKNTNYE